MRQIISNPETVRQAIHDSVVKALTSKFPLVGKNYTVTLDKIWLEHNPISRNTHKLLLMAKGNASDGVYVDFTLRDKDGEAIYTIPKHRIMSLPYFTDRFTFLMEGNEYNIVNQLRIKSGVYTRVRSNSEIESSFNLAKGANFKLIMDPATGEFKILILHSTLSMYAVLKVLGADDSIIKSYLGDKLFEVNSKVSSAAMEKAVDILYEKLAQYKTALGDKASKAEKILKVQEYFRGTKLNPETTAITLGTAHDSVTYTAILEAARKILKLYNAEEDVDERDNLEFQTIHCVEDIIGEVISKDTSGFGKFKSKFNSFVVTGNTGNDVKRLKDIFSPAILSKPVKHFITNSTISRLQAQINPMELMDSTAIVTKMGEGAIMSEDAVPDEARSINYSYMGLLDPIATPESSKTGIDNRVTISAHKEGNELYKKVINLHSNKEELVRPIDMYSKYVGMPDASYKTIQASDMLPAIHKGKLVKVQRMQLDYIIPSPHDLHTITTNTVPFINANQANRILMAAKHVTQAMPLKDPDTRLVESVIYKTELGNSSSEIVGSMFTPKSPFDGTIEKVDDEYIHINFYIKPASGEMIKVVYDNNVPLATKTILINVPIVKPGDKVKKGQTLATSNFTKDGKLAIGKNLLVASMPYYGLNHEDGIVISEEASKKLTSVHAEKVFIELTDNKLLDKGKYLSFFPTAFTKEQIRHIDSDGVAVKGTTLKKGDPVALILMDNSNNHVNQMLGKLHKSLVRRYSDGSEIYENENPAEVIEVLKTGRIVTLILKSEHPAVIGDKLCYDPETEVLTKRGWLPIPKLNMEDEICCLDPATDQIKYYKPIMLHQYDYDSLMYSMESKNYSFLVTPEHKMYVRLSSEGTFDLVKATDIFGKSVKYKKNGTWTGTEIPHFELAIDDNAIHLVPMDLFLKFIGYYLGGGFYIDKREFSSESKRIPRWVLSLSVRQCKILYNTLMATNGCHKGGYIMYCSTSKALCDDIQELAFKIGKICDVKVMQDGCYDKYICRIYDILPDDDNNDKVEKYVEYTGKVYCCTVPTNILFVRRNGKTAWCGNSATYGNKGVISKILSMDKMPTDESGKPIDVIVTPFSVPARINPAQILEMKLGKVAVKTGVPYNIENFSKENYLDFVQSEMDKHGVKDKETIFDPVSGKKIPNVSTGVHYFHKLFKTTDKNFSARGIEGSYDQDDVPVGTGEIGPKALGTMEVNALIAHNARSLMHEGATLRNSRNSDFWKQFQYGGMFHMPVEKKVFNKFSSILKQAGINMFREGNNLVLAPLTDKDVIEMSSGEIKEPSRLNAKLEPEPGGLFDINCTGGLSGTKWSHIKLSKPVISPVFENCIKNLLDINSSQMKDLYIKEGGKELRKKLNNIDIEAMLKDTDEQLKNTKLKPEEIDKLIKRLKYLKVLKERNMKAGEAYMLSNIPVTPPMIRPIVPGISGDLMENDANALYRDLILQNNDMEELKKNKLTEEVENNRAAIYDRVKEVVGTVAPANPQNINKKGALAFIAGDQPKYGMFQRKIIYSKMNLTGRSTIAPDDTLGLDEIGMPEEMAWNMYKPFLLRSLVQNGYSAIRAKEVIENRTEDAKKLLISEMEKRPVLLNRAPTLWKYNIMAMKPLLRDGKHLGVNSLWERGYNADHDGDAMQIHLPVSDGSIEDAKNIFPSKLIFTESKKNDILMAPKNEPIVGLYKVTQNLGKPISGKPKNYKNLEAAWQDYYKGDLKATDPIEIAHS